MWDFDNETGIWDSPAQVIAAFGDALVVLQKRNVFSDWVATLLLPGAAMVL